MYQLHMLAPGARLHTEDGQPLTVQRFLGAGGQGEVYAAECGGQEWALKWYYPPRDAAGTQRLEEQRAALRGYIVKKPPPDPRFLWPRAYVEQGDAFGYLMPLREQRFTDFERLVAGVCRPAPTYRELCNAAVGLADCFYRLHLSGAVYKDINLGGPFLDPTTGDVLICDNDNVRIDGTPGTILFMPFGAPEVVRGEATCSTWTDYHSLAVLLFYMFVRDHPLEGEREAKINAFNEAAKRKLYGTEPVFVYDPDDASNRPVRGIHVSALRNWPVLPAFLRDAFVRVFTEGLRDPRKRLTDGEWMDCFSSLRDSLFACSGCGRETFYDRAVLKAGAGLKCRWCGAAQTPPLRMKIGRRVVVLSPKTALYPHHLGRDRDFSSPVAALNQHPRDPTRWGLKNLGAQKWTWTAADGSTREVPPGRSVAIRDGLEILFGPVRGQIRS